MEGKKRKQCPYKPGSVSPCGEPCHLSTPWVTPRLQHSTLHRCIASDGQPSDDGIHELAASSDTARRSPAAWWSLTPPSHPYPTCGIHNTAVSGGYFLLPYPTVTNSFYFRKWSTLCCPDFPLALMKGQRQGRESAFQLQTYIFFLNFASPFHKNRIFSPLFEKKSAYPIKNY